MKAIGLNPYLPYWENVPDGEPHVFGERIYIFGSHDRAGGSAFCVEDYACWSAPTDDLGNWRYEGIIYGKMQDPINGAPYSGEIPPYDNAFAGQEPHLLYAPDVARGRTAGITYIILWILPILFPWQSVIRLRGNMNFWLM